MKKIKNSYKKSGVDISLANKLVKHISSLSKKMSKKGKNPSMQILSVVSGLCLILVNIKLKILQ